MAGSEESVYREYCSVLTCTGLFSGRQLWTVRLQGTQRQQRGPIQTQLPDWLDSGRRRWDSGGAERPDEERLFAAWFDQTNTITAQSIKHLHLQHIFKEHPH